VYFARDDKSLWRVKLDGTGLDSLTSYSTSRSYKAPTVSPDGRSVAVEDGDGLQIVDVATKAKRTVAVPCAYPSYSPDGSYFACTLNNLSSESNVSVMRTDGSGRRVLATFSPYDGPDGFSGVDWTPDGKWLLVTKNVGYAVLIEVSTGELLPLLALPTDAGSPLELDVGGEPRSIDAAEHVGRDPLRGVDASRCDETSHGETMSASQARCASDPPKRMPGSSRTERSDTDAPLAARLRAAAASPTSVAPQHLARASPTRTERILRAAALRLHAKSAQGVNNRDRESDPFYISTHNL
jgi:hypothetical protein